MDDPDQASSITVSDPNVETGHGLIETRAAAVCHDSDGLGAHDGLALAVMEPVTAQRQIWGKQSGETPAPYLRNKKLTPEQLLRHVRSHWAIENALHGSLDVTMNEDDFRNRTGPETLAVLQRFSLNPARLAFDRRTSSIFGEDLKKLDGITIMLKHIRLAGLLPKNGAFEKRYP